MSLLEVEKWEIAGGNEEAHHQMIRAWFQFVKEHYAELFAEWKSTRYYRETDREGQPTARYVMLFEFRSVEVLPPFGARSAERVLEFDGVEPGRGEGGQRAGDVGGKLLPHAPELGADRNLLPRGSGRCRQRREDECRGSCGPA